MNTLRKLQENINITQFLKDRSKYIATSENLKLHCTFKIGGQASLFVTPNSEKSFIEILDFLKTEDIDFFILGGGSNLVFPDKNFDCVVLSTTGLSSISFTPSTNLQNQINKSQVIVNCDAGCLMQDVVDFCTENCITGLESFSGLPGTVGGATFMNARCYDTSISDLIYSVNYLTIQSNDTSTPCWTTNQYIFNKADWDYKSSPFQYANSTKLKVITQTSFILEQLEKTIEQRQSIKEKTNYFINDRIQKGHFRFPSAGSVFKNNRNFGKPSGKIIDEVGLRGFSIGKARIAPWHGNFIINEGGASAKDVKQLVEYAINKVRSKTGFSLEPEILFASKIDKQLL